MSRLVAAIGLVFSAYVSAGCSIQKPMPAEPPSIRIEEARFLELGGIDQWITIRGDDAQSQSSLLPFQMQENLSTTALRFELPYYVIQGRDDLLTPTEPAAAYFAKVSAPKKEMVILEGAGHFALATHQQQFLAALREVLSM